MQENYFSLPKKFKNVTEMVENLTTDKVFKANILNSLKHRDISKFLFTLRCKNNLTQKEMAKKLNYSIKEIEKIESSFDYNLTIKQICDYCYLFKINVEMRFKKK
jgi:DNA-binding XRE family transcriptional regulator